jgi:hypothetical protein
MLGKDALYAAYFAGAGGVTKGEKFVGQGYSNRTAVGTAVGDEAQSVYAVLSGRVFNGGCCFDYGNAERLLGHSAPYWGNGSMEAIYFGCGDLSPPLACSPADPSGGPYVLADMEHMRGMMAGPMPPTPISPRDFVVAMVKGKPGHLALKAGAGQRQHSLEVIYEGPRPAGYEVMKKEGAIVLGVGGDNSPWGAGVFYEGAITTGYASNETDQAVLASVVGAGYDLPHVGSPPAGVGLKSDDSVRLAPAIDAAAVTYQAPGVAAAERNVSAALSDMISVLDFGAKGSCLCEQQNMPMSASCCPDDDTAAFTAAIAASPSVFVPPGSYRIDSTVHIAGGTRLSLSGGASLMRTNLSTSSEPVVLLSGWYGSLTGSGHITTVNPAPAGVVKIGPATATRLYNVEWNVVEGISIRGPGVSWSYAEPDKPVDAALNGSIGVCFDSNEGSVGGATYQNTLKDVTVQAIDVGVYLGVQVNGNQVSGVMMEAIGQSAYLLQGPNSENVLQGGFVAGHGGNTTVIKTRASWNPKTLKHEGTWHNWFSGILCEPGPGSLYYDFDEFSTANTLIGHDNTYRGGVTHDPAFTYLSSGTLRIGDFNSSQSHDHLPPSGPWKPPQGSTVVLQVEGLGYIKSLEHGMPARQIGTKDSRVEAIHDEPVLLVSSDDSVQTRRLGRQPLKQLSRIEVMGMAAAQSGAHQGCYYEVTISGSSSSAETTSVYTGRYLATPYRTRAGEPRVVVKALTPAERLELGDSTWSVVPAAVAITAEGTGGGEGAALALHLPSLSDATTYELVVDSRRVGHGCAPAAVHAK